MFVPRTEFDRKTNAELVTRGLQKLNLAAYVNDRNDICIDGFKMSFVRPISQTRAVLTLKAVRARAGDFGGASYVSGSAFKLVNKRAYHHGTMLIDAKLGDLRGVLGSQRVRFSAQGESTGPPPLRMDSLTSPVCRIRW